MGRGDKRYNLIISERAGEMFIQNARFLAQVSARAADKLRNDIVETAKSLEDYPERGSWFIDSLLPANKYRKLLVDKRYLLIHQIKDDKVYIDYLVDCRQDYAWLIS
jgi:plasmid stabilization system protein ParE